MKRLYINEIAINLTIRDSLSLLMLIFSFEMYLINCFIRTIAFKLIF